jgi:hypothetical protein
MVWLDLALHRFGKGSWRMVDDIRKALAARDYAAAHGWAPRCLSDHATQTLKEAGKDEILRSLKNNHADLANHREDYVEYGDPESLTPEQRAKSNCRLLRLALVHRADCLMVATGQMFDSKNLYGLALVVRGHVEAVALLGYFARRLDALHKKNIEFERFEEDIAGALMGAKDAIFVAAKDPVNIMTRLDHADKHLDAELFKKKGLLQEVYTWLSEFAHPNFCSNKTAFTLEKETGRMVLRKDEETNDDHFQMLSSLSMSADMFSWLLDDFSVRLERALP